MLQILCMRKFKTLELILQVASGKSRIDIQKPSVDPKVCSGFLCKGDDSCTDVYRAALVLNPVHYYDLVLSATEVILYVGNCEEFEDILLPVIIKQKDWAKCFERRHVSIYIYIYIRLNQTKSFVKPI